MHELFLDSSCILKKDPILTHTSWSRNLRLELVFSNEALLLSFMKTWGTEAGPTRGGSGLPEASAGPLVRWGTMAGEGQTDTPCRKSVGIQVI